VTEWLALAGNVPKPVAKEFHERLRDVPMETTF
jgi:hypothetical protein